MSALSTEEATEGVDGEEDNLRGAGIGGMIAFFLVLVSKAGGEDQQHKMTHVRAGRHVSRALGEALRQIRLEGLTRLWRNRDVLRLPLQRLHCLYTEIG